MRLKIVCVVAVLAVALVGCENRTEERSADAPLNPELDGRVGPCIHQPEFIEDAEWGDFGSGSAGGAPVAGADRGTEKPVEIVVNFARAIQGGSLPDAIGCIDCPAEDRMFAEGAIKYAISLAAFIQKAKQQYAADFDAAKVPGREILVLPEDVEKWGDIAPTGDAAALPDPQGQKFGLRKKEEKWYLTLVNIPPAEERAPVLQLMSSMKAKVDELTGKIGQQGVTAESLLTELGQAPAGGAAPAPGT
jgi:hypothetical protein